MSDIYNETYNQSSIHPQYEFDPISCKNLTDSQLSADFQYLSNISIGQNPRAILTDITNKPYLGNEINQIKIDQSYKSQPGPGAQKFDQTLNLDDDTLSQHLYQLNSFLEDEEEAPAVAKPEGNSIENFEEEHQRLTQELKHLKTENMSKKELILEYDDKTAKLEERNNILKKELKIDSWPGDLPRIEEEYFPEQKIALITQQIPLLKEENERMTNIISKNNESIELWKNLCEEISQKLNKIEENMDGIEQKLNSLEENSLNLINENESMAVELLKIEEGLKKKVIDGNCELRSQYLELEKLEKKVKELEATLIEERRKTIDTEINEGRLSDLTRKINILLEENDNLNDSARTIIEKNERLVALELEYTHKQDVLLTEKNRLGGKLKTEVNRYKNLKRMSKATAKMGLHQGKHMFYV